MMLEKIYDKYDFDQDYEVYKYGQQVLIFNSIVNIFMFILGLCLHEGLMTLVWMFIVIVLLNVLYLPI